MALAEPHHAAPMGLKTILFGRWYYKHVAPTELVAKAEIDAKDKVHVTPLYWAAEIGDTNMTKIGPLGPFGLDETAPAMAQ